MQISKIQDNLIKRFDAPLKDFYKRRIIFWQDIEREWESAIDELSLPNAKVIKLTGTNNFYVKKLLLNDDTDSNYLVYNPLSYDSIEEDCFTDIQAYSEEFRTDLTSQRMEDLSIPESPQMRAVIKGYARFFENKERVSKVKAYNTSYSTTASVHIDILSVLVGAKTNTSNGIFESIFLCGLDGENEKIESVKKFGDIEALYRLISAKTGYIFSENCKVREWFYHVMLNALSYTFKEKLDGKAQNYLSYAHQAYCYEFINDWAHSENDDSLYYLCREVETEFNLPAFFDKVEVEALLSTECLPCINECIIRRFLTDVAVNNTISSTEVISVIEKRRTSKWFKRVRHYYDCLLAVAKLRGFYQENVQALHIVQAKQLFDAYVDKFYLMDTYYRDFHLAFGKALKESSTGLEDMLKAVADYVENLYVNWYLNTLGNQWMLATEEEYTENGVISGIPTQDRFYEKYITSTLRSGTRAYVIISDALRYEVAKELTESLVKETRGSAEISAMQGVFPTATEFGMAALLPHKHLAYDGDKVLVDGMPCDGTNNREKILKARNENSIAITYKDFLIMKQSERRELVKNVEVVYIYHNSIDAVAEKKATEDDVFEACEEAITEIKNLVRIVTNELSGSNVFITADHGFIYSYLPLKEYDKVEKDSSFIGIKKLDRRFVLAEKDSQAEYLLKLSINAFDTDLVGFAPKGYLRVKMQGGGLNFVHGGLSLQEMTIPVVTFKNMRAGAKKFVETQKAQLQILSASRKVSNTLFSLDFYQKQPVEGKTVECSYFVYMADEKGTVVSDKQKVICDKTDADAQERQFRLRFSLKGNTFDKNKTYYLTIAEESGVIVEKIEFTIDIAFVDDFGDF